MEQIITQYSLTIKQHGGCVYFCCSQNGIHCISIHINNNSIAWLWIDCDLKGSYGVLIAHFVNLLGQTHVIFIAEEGIPDTELHQKKLTKEWGTHLDNN